MRRVRRRRAERDGRRHAEREWRRRASSIGRRRAEALWTDWHTIVTPGQWPPPSRADRLDANGGGGGLPKKGGSLSEPRRRARGVHQTVPSSRRSFQAGGPSDVTATITPGASAVEVAGAAIPLQSAASRSATASPASDTSCASENRDAFCHMKR